jgi:siroheme synthase
MTKELGADSRTHDEIQRRMAEAARNGQCVVRLIFGGIPSDRDAQREIIILRERGIEAELLAGTPLATAETGA